jgi:hypothetical protein
MEKTGEEGGDYQQHEGEEQYRGAPEGGSANGDQHLTEEQRQKNLLEAKRQR